jgi:hypothetical protein
LFVFGKKQETKGKTKEGGRKEIEERRRRDDGRDVVLMIKGNKKNEIKREKNK